MEKRTAHYKLARVRELLASGHMRMTRAAFDSASGMGLNSHIVRDLLLQLDPLDFYKSMTTYEDHRVWQDVYIPITRYGALYVKLTVIEHVLVVSLKYR